MTTTATPAQAADVVLVGLGANLPSPAGDARVTCEAALRALEGRGLTIVRRSRWYRSAPVPPSDQPWFVNGVAEIRGMVDPIAGLAILHDVEASLGRVRRQRDEPRVIDLDLLAFGPLIRDEAPILPHPRLHQRAFVLHPMRELVPTWRHPRLGRTLAELIADLDPGQIAEAMP